MKKLFSRKFVSVSFLIIFTVSLFTWGIISGQDAADTSVTVIPSALSLSVAPVAIEFDRADSVGNGVPGGYGDINRGSTNIYADSLITATVESETSYNLTVEGTDMERVGGIPADPVIPVGNVSFQYDGGAWTVLTGGADEILDDGEDTSPGTEDHDVGFRINSIPGDLIVEGGGTEYTGVLTFDVNVL